MRSAQLARLLKEKYELVAGEITLSDTLKEASRLGALKITIAGRSLKTGRKKIVNIPLAKLL